MNYTIKTHAPIINRMFSELYDILPRENSDSAELKNFLMKIRSLLKYTATVHEMAKTEEE